MNYEQKERRFEGSWLQTIHVSFVNSQTPSVELKILLVLIQYSVKQKLL